MINKMKAASFVFLFLDLVAGVMATLTSIHVSPSFLMASSGFTNTLLTTMFWVCVSGLTILTAIALAIIHVADKISG
jgi:hypothetical protein